MSVVCLVPRRDDHGRRDELWRWLRSRWFRNHPDWPIVEGHDSDEPFNRARARNLAAVDAPPAWELCVIADADSLVAKAQLEAAVEVARTSGRVVLAYSEFRYLTRDMTDRMLAGQRDGWEQGVERVVPDACSSMVVVPRALWDTVGGYDDRFVGWGWEDRAFFAACETLGGSAGRVEGPVWHLWHDRADCEDGPTEPANHDLFLQYAAARCDRTAMLALLDERPR